MAASAHIVLVRTPHDGEKDPYHSTLASPYRTHHLPVLSTTFTNQSHLANIIHAGPTDHYSGVIVTSQRAVEAWASASPPHPQNGSSEPASIPPWSTLPFFLVGPATRSALLSTLPSPAPPFLGATTTGTGALLAQSILSHFATSPPPTLPLLYLVGDKNRETIPNLLAAGGIGVERVQVYQTEVLPDFEERLGRVLERVLAEGRESGKERKEGKERPTVWFAVFSPSGAKPLLEALRKKGLLPAKGEVEGKGTGGIEGVRVRLAGIGPTTKSYVEGDEGLRMDAVAASPDPVHLLAAITSAGA